MARHEDMTYGELHRSLSDRWTGLLGEMVVVDGPLVMVAGPGTMRVLTATLVGVDVTVMAQLPNDSRDVTPCVRELEAALLATRVWH